MKEVEPIVPGQEVFSPNQMRQLLGGICRSSYYEIRASGLLKFSRVGKGKQVVHTKAQYDAYVAYLNNDGQVATASDIADWKSRRAG